MYGGALAGGGGGSDASLESLERVAVRACCGIGSPTLSRLDYVDVSMMEK